MMARLKLGLTGIDDKKGIRKKYQKRNQKEIYQKIRLNSKSDENVDHLEQDGVSGALQVGLALNFEQRLGLSLLPFS